VRWCVGGVEIRTGHLLARDGSREVVGPLAAVLGRDLDADEAWAARSQ
jgi:hypothetical protein